MTTINSPAETAPRAVALSASAVEWGAVFAGAVFAASLSFVFLTFGSAVGLSMTSAWPGSGTSAKWTGTLAAFWILAQQIGALLAGGYLAGRLRKEPEARTDQTEFRDGIHGGLVWAVGILIGAMLAASAAMVATRVGLEAGRTAVSTASQNSEQFSYFTDVLLRPAPQAQPGPAAQGQAVPQDARSEIARILARSTVNRELSQADRNYLAGVVAQRTGIAPDEAQRRVSETFAQLEQSLRSAADQVRKTGALGGFIAAAGVVIAFAAAWWGAIRGGHHRDNNFTQSGLHLRSRRTQEFNR